MVVTGAWFIVVFTTLYGNIMGISWEWAADPRPGATHLQSSPSSVPSEPQAGGLCKWGDCPNFWMVFNGKKT